MKENIDLGAAIGMIQDYAIKIVYPTGGTFSNSVDITKQPEAHSLPPRILNQVPDVILKLYGEEKGTLKWKELATSIFRLTLVADVRVEVAKLMRDILEMWDKERKYMYKGKDKKDYTSSEEVRSVDEFNPKEQNPPIDNSRERKYMYKGKDGNYYTSFEEVGSVDEFYTQEQNPPIDNSRIR